MTNHTSSNINEFTVVAYSASKCMNQRINKNPKHPPPQPPLPANSLAVKRVSREILIICKFMTLTDLKRSLGKHKGDGSELMRSEVRTSKQLITRTDIFEQWLISLLSKAEIMWMFNVFKIQSKNTVTREQIEWILSRKVLKWLGLGAQLTQDLI